MNEEYRNRKYKMGENKMNTIRMLDNITQNMGELKTAAFDFKKAVKK